MESQLNVHVYKLTSCGILALSTSIVWDDCEGIHVTGNGMVGNEYVVCLCEVAAVSTGDRCWVLLIRNIVDEDKVPDVMIHTSHIQRKWRTPGHSNR